MELVAALKTKFSQIYSTNPVQSKTQPPEEQPENTLYFNSELLDEAREDVIKA
jgi:hypothetical protein